MEPLRGLLNEYWLSGSIIYGTPPGFGSHSASQNYY
jgi:hypothetical protein